MLQVVQENREYQRILPSDKSIDILEEHGLEWVFSSNVSAATVRGRDLIVRFHNGSMYSYSNQGKLFERLMGAASKGKWVWRFLRRPNVPFTKIGSLPLAEDTDESDFEVIKPRIPMFKVEAILPTDADRMKGVLPQIKITALQPLQSTTIPVAQQTSIMTMNDVTLEQVTIPLEETKLVFTEKDTVEVMSVDILELVKESSIVKKVSVVDTSQNVKEARKQFWQVDNDLVEKQGNTLNKLLNEYDSEVEEITLGYCPDGALGMVIREDDETKSRLYIKSVTNKQTIRTYKSQSFSKYNVTVDKENENIATVVHEFAHTLYDKDQLYLYPKDHHMHEFHKELKSIKRKKTLFENKQWNVIKSSASEEDKENAKIKLEEARISNYSRTNLDEFLAESFSQGKLSSKPSPFATQVVELVDKHFKKGSD
jgi:hypothetical protein